MHVRLEQPPGQQIPVPSPQFAGTGTRKDETQPPITFHQAMHNIEQRRHLLYFVDQHVARLGVTRNQLAQPLWPCQIEALCLRVEQVEPDCALP